MNIKKLTRAQMAAWEAIKYLVEQRKDYWRGYRALWHGVIRGEPSVSASLRTLQGIERAGLIKLERVAVYGGSKEFTLTDAGKAAQPDTASDAAVVDVFKPGDYVRLKADAIISTDADEIYVRDKRLIGRVSHYLLHKPEHFRVEFEDENGNSYSYARFLPDQYERADVPAVDAARNAVDVDDTVRYIGKDPLPHGIAQDATGSVIMIIAEETVKTHLVRFDGMALADERLAETWFDPADLEVVETAKDYYRRELNAVRRECALYRKFYEFVVGVDGQYPVLEILQSEGVDLLDWAEFHNLLEDIHALRKQANAEALADETVKEA